MDQVDSLLTTHALHEEFEEMSDEAVEALRVEAIDRWTWDTGSDEHAVLITKLEREMRWRIYNHSRRQREAVQKDAQEQLLSEFAEDIRREVDREILLDLYGHIDNKGD